MNLNQTDYGSSINSLVTKIYTFPSAHTRVLLTEPVQAWHDKVMEQLKGLVQLNPGWDGYQGLPVSFENAIFALRILEAICRNDTPSPQIIPGGSGDLQIEWHTMQGDIELHVKAPNNVQAWHSPLSDGSGEEELDLQFDFTDVANWVKKVTEAPIAIEAAAA